MSAMAARTRCDDGFSLVELVLVVVIIGVVAAVATPSFLARRERAWGAQVQSDLYNAGLEVESAHESGVDYAAADLAGWTGSTGVNVTWERGGATFCLEGTHDNIAGGVWSYDSGDGGLQPRGAPC